MDTETRTRLQKYIRTTKTEPLDPETEALRDWLNCMAFLWEAIGRQYDANQTTEKQFDAYVRIFGSVPLEILEKGITRAIANNGKWQTIPTPGAIWESIRKEMELSSNDDVLEAMQHKTINDWDKCVIRIEAIS